MQSQPKAKAPKPVTLHLSSNSKTRFAKNKSNSVGFLPGLPSNGGTCPGATTGTGGCCAVRAGCSTATCYVNKVMRIYSGVEIKLKENTDKMNAASLEEKIALLDETVKQFKKENKQENWFFRYTWSGDILNEDYATAMVEVASRHLDVQFWAYTRSHQYAYKFAGLPNFALYLSADPVNVAQATKVYEELKASNNIGIAWLDDKTKPEDRRWVTCPETSGKLKNDADRGACAKCRLCFTYNDKIKLRAISFSIH